MIARGKASMTGTACYVERCDEIGELASTLPRLAADVAVVIVERRQAGFKADGRARYRELEIRVERVEEALRWLILNSPAYADVKIDAAALEALGRSAYLDVPTIEGGDDDAVHSAASVVGVAPAQSRPPPEAADSDEAPCLESSGVTTTGGAAGLAASAAAKAAELAGAGAAGAAGAAPPPLPRAVRQEYGAYVAWNRVPFFFAAAWPTLFIPDGGDVPAEFVPLEGGRRAKQPSFVAYAAHLMAVPRYAAHPSLHFALKVRCPPCCRAWPTRVHAPALRVFLTVPARQGIKDSSQGMKAMGYACSQMPDAEPLDADGIRALLLEEHGAAKVDKVRKAHGWPRGWATFPALYYTVPAASHGRTFVFRAELTLFVSLQMAGRVASYGQSHPGSPAYWWMVKKKLDAQVKRRKFRDQELPLFFMTGTAAEYHWPEVRRVLAVVSELTGFPEEAVLIRAEVGRAGPALHRAITRFPAIVNELFELRTAAFFSTVLEGGLGLLQHFRKFEFGKHAGHAHWHSLLYGGEKALILQRLLDPALQETTLDAMVAAEAEAALGVAARQRELFGDAVTAEHPAGRERSATSAASLGQETSMWYSDRRAAIAHRDGCSKAVCGTCKLNDTRALRTDTATCARVGNIDRWPPPEGQHSSLFMRSGSSTPAESAADPGGGRYAMDAASAVPKPTPKSTPKPARLSMASLNTKLYQLRGADERTDDMVRTMRCHRPAARHTFARVCPPSGPRVTRARGSRQVNFANGVLLHSCCPYCLKLKRDPPSWRPVDDARKASTSAGGKKGAGVEEGAPKGKTDGQVRVMQCRFGFGDECYKGECRAVRTEGKPARTAPGFTTRAERMTEYAPPRDHPRLVGGMQVVARYWGANYDSQWVVGPTTDLPAAIVTDGSAPFLTTLRDYMARQEADHLAHSQAAGAGAATPGASTVSEYTSVREARAARSYKDLDSHESKLCDYITSYIGKDEMSASGAVDLLKDLVMEAPGSTTFASLAMQMQMKILKNRQTSSTECLWSVAQLPYIASSHQYVFIARPGERTIEAAADDDDGGGDGGAAPRLKKGHWDVYVKLMKSAEKNQMTDVCFDTWVAKEESIVPVYNFYSLDAVWPLDSPRGLKFALDVLTLYKPVKSHAELLGTHASYSAALESFLEHKLCPAGLRMAVARAALRVHFETTKPGKVHRTFSGGGGKGGRARKPRAGDDQVPREDAADSGDEGVDPHNPLYGGGEAGDEVLPFEVPADLDERPAGTDLPAAFRGSLPGYAELVAIAEGLRASLPAPTELVEPLPHAPGAAPRYPDVREANELQRVLLADVLWYFHDLAAWNESPEAERRPKPKLHGICVGVAGTGKTFIQKFVTLLSRLFTLHADAAVTMASSGSAAVACRGGTPESVIGMGNRNSNVFTTPGVNRLGPLQRQRQRCITALVDEISLIGLGLMGHMANAFGYTFNGGDYDLQSSVLWGGLEIVLFFGDFCQLPPVLDIGGVLYQVMDPEYRGTTRPDRQQVVGAGEVAYRSLMAAPYVLRQPVRQDVACPLYRELMDARNGCIAMDPPDAPAPPAGVRFWNSLGRTFLDKAQLANFDLAKESVLYLACKRKRKAAVNAEYMATLPDACVMRAQCTGPHSFDDNEQVNKMLGRLKAIPRTNVLAVGGSVKLLTNISPERGLANGARGHVRDIIYPPDPVTGAAGGYSKPPPGGDTTTWPVCIVEFPTYTGEVLVPGHPTFVPICAMTMNCGSANGKCQKCTRHGLPLGCGAPRVGRWPPRTPRRSLPARRRAHGPLALRATHAPAPHGA